MPLPYKVYDKKGKASYDKNKKFLKVTLPVVPPETQKTTDSEGATPSKVEEVASSSAATSPKKETASAGKVDTDSANSSAASSPTKPIKGQDKEKSHNRWVEKSTTEVVNDESKALYEEIARQAELAKKAALEQKAKPAAAPVIPAATEIDNKPKTVESVEEVGDKQEYIPSKTFTGRKEGYVFKTGDNGLGYYLDRKITDAKPAVTPAPAPKEEAKVANVKEVEPVITYQIPLVQAKQTKQAISLLFQVPQIVLTTVKITSNSPYSVDFRFAAFDGSDKQVEYGVGLELQQKLCADGIDCDSITFDVASKNMVVVLLKKSHQIYHSVGSTAADSVLTIEKSDVDSSGAYIRLREFKSGCTNQASSSSAINVGTKENQSNKEGSTSKSAPSAAATGASQQVKQVASQALKSMTTTMQFNTNFINELD